jgi:RHS repeat-associated protein
MFDAERDVTVYFELDAIGNVRRLRAGHRTDPSNTDPLPSDLGGYRYSAFGKLKAPDAATPAPALDGDPYQQPFRWQGRPYLDIAGGLYDFRARTWSPELGAFLQADKFEFLGPSTTLWSWPGQNPIRNRDTTGRINLVSLNASSIGASILATVSRGITASVARAFSTAAVFTPVAQAAADKAKSAVVVGWRVGNLVFGRLTSSGSALAARAAQAALHPALKLPGAANTVNHIFGRAAHNLGGLVTQFGSREAAYTALYDATSAAVRVQGTTGLFQSAVNVAGQTVTVRGNVIDGVLRISTAFIP